MKLIVGLGNPGKQYANTRHNIGFMILDELAKNWGVSFDKNKFNADYTVAYYNGIRYLLIKPTTYMNLSGEALRKFYDYFEIDIDDILVVYDDLDTKTASFKLKAKGSSGGHNGIKSIISHLGTENFNRLKIGIDRPTPPMKVVDYVLGKFSKEEMNEIEKIYKKSIDAIEDFSKMNIVELMNKYN
ncbi:MULTISPECIES: aminoacyl-tRNA hydrolase [Gemella]|uniref:aminoacyl-tRNA hydrolase n=1 Tax=Gemella TaxID=1378 RepID=UPI0007683D12|nr:MULTISPECIES: aminoacyl-tRNA hydrolase [Gemella]AME09251.1 peptidyl-tRNA hydrolase [Gemella sp. oral taxon 928]AXI26884.1 aminoacyl-tRNA hydrolase [Gemella sp. ND 6198]